MLALGADFRQQLRQLRTQVETLHQLHAMVARLDRAERAAGLVLLETHPGQHLLAVANDRFDGAVVGFQHQQRALASPPTRREMPVEVDEQLRRTAAPAVDRLPVVADGHQARRGALGRQATVQRL